MASSLSSFRTRISNHLKPHRTEALYRLRTNGICLVTGIIMSYVLPFPSLHEAVLIARGTHESEFGSGDWFYCWFCIIEVAIFSLLAVNILHALYAVRYPRTWFPPLPSPGTPKNIKKAPVSPQRSFKVLSPNSSPQPQKSFSFSPSSSFGLSVAANYPTSPVSTPSRVVHYPVPPDASATSSSISLLSTPSPLISAYRGKHLSNSIGHALDGSYLGQFIVENVDDDE